LADSSTGGEFLQDLQKKGIDLVLRYGNRGRLFGVTFINHNSRTVLNGSALGKEFSANALGTRFADFAQGDNHREDMQLVPFAPAKETVRPSMQHELEDKQPATVKGCSGDDSPLGSLLSVFTPETNQHDDNEPVPTKKRKKKRRYGRQI
jgi:hypothetical protein